MSINGESSTLVLFFLGVAIDNCKDTACLKNRKEHLDAAEKILFGQIDPKLCCFGGKTHTHTHTQWEKGTVYQQQNHISAVKYGGQAIMVWRCFVASGPGQLVISD